MDKGTKWEDIPGWVGFWVPPSRRPLVSFAVLGILLTMAWLPVALDWRPWGSDPWWGSGVCSLVALWEMLAIVWMYRHRKWRLGK